MKKVLLGLILSVGMAIPAFAQQQCAPYEQVPAMLEATYGEVLTAQGIVDPTHVVQLYRNPVTGSFSIIGVDTQGVACMLAGGDYWDATVPKKKENPS